MPSIGNQYEAVLDEATNPSEVNPTAVRVADSSFPHHVPTHDLLMAQVRRAAPGNSGARASSWLDAPQTASHISQLMDSFHVPGLTIAIVDGSDICAQAFGYACIETQKPCTPHTLFDIASCSKALTAISVAMLVESNDFPEMRWDSVMSELLSHDFVLSSPEATKEVTIEDILSHRSGLPGHVLFDFSSPHELTSTGTT